MVKPIVEALASLTKQNAGELIEQWFDESAEGEELKPKEGINVANELKELIRGKIREVADDQHGRGKRETAEDWEKMLRNAGLKDTSLRGEEALSAFVTQIKSEKGDKGGSDAITPELLDTDETAKQWLESKVKALKEAKEAAEAKVQEVTTSYHRKQLVNTAKSKAVEILDNIKWIDGGEDMRSKRVETIHKLLDFDRLKLDDSGNLVVLDDNGQPLKDDNFNPVSFDGFVKQINPFGTHKHDPTKKTASPKTKTGDGGEGGLTFSSHEQIAAANAKASKERDPQKRAELKREIMAAAAKFAETQQ
jgi:hypothetical protein